MKTIRDILFCTVAGGAVLTACTVASDGAFLQSGTDNISYKVAAKPATRGTALTGSTFPVEKQFAIYAWQQGSSDAPLISGETVSYDGATALWRTTNNYYWPQGAVAMDFFAVYPSTTALTPAATCTIDSYTAPTVNSTQNDVMYATVVGLAKSGTAKSGSARTVALNFHHALSRIGFTAATQESGLNVSVNSVTICHLSSTETFTYPASTDGTGSWTNLNTAYTDYSLTMAEPVKTLTTTQANLAATNGDLLMIPQTQTAWTVGSAPANCYVKIGCTIAIAGAEPLISNGYVYIPLAPAWSPGQYYLYSLRFGVGYDENGQPVGDNQALNISLQLYDWTAGQTFDFDFDTGRITSNELFPTTMTIIDWAPGSAPIDIMLGSDIAATIGAIEGWNVGQTLNVLFANW